MSNNPVNWSDFAKWFIFTFLALISGFVIFILLFIIISVLGSNPDNTPDYLFGAILGLIFGFCFGFSYHYFLKKYILDLRYWIAGSTFAFSLSSLIIFGWLNYEGNFLIQMTHPIVLGLFFGGSQWGILKRNNFGKSEMWIIISVIGWVIGETIGFITENFLGPLSLFLTFLIGASLPGIGMIWLLKQQSTDSTNQI